MKKHWKFFIPPVVLIGVFINTYFQCRHEFQGKYNFKINSIDTSGSGVLSFYDDLNNHITLWNYMIRVDSGVKVGDSISKNSCAEYLEVYRFNSPKGSKKILSLKAAELFPQHWFCN
ncbi:MAG: hypothetical protein V4594_06575 [Bacteroidota bacterium]